MRCVVLMMRQEQHEIAMPLPGQSVSPILILGLGNILLQDEGIGVKVVEALLQKYQFPENVEVMDGGTAGMALYEHVLGREHLIVVDAVKTGRPPGSIVCLQNEEVPVYFRARVSPHQLALADLLAAMEIAGRKPPRVQVIGIEPVALGTGLDLSAQVQDKLNTLMNRVITELEKIDVTVTVRT